MCSKKSPTKGKNRYIQKKNWGVEKATSKATVANCAKNRSGQNKGKKLDKER